MGILDPGPELIILLVIVALLLFGSSKIPEMARNVGRAAGEFKRGKKEVEREMAEEEAKGAARSKATKDITIDEKLVKKARKLGIDPAGKSRDELMAEIIAKEEEEEEEEKDDEK